MKKAKLWAHATYEMVEHDDFSRRLNLPAYVRAENYDFLIRRCENLETENARLKAEVERLRITEQNQTNRVISLEDCIQVLKQDRDGLLYEESEQIARLKAEVERLTALNKKIMATADVIDANNQRLTKAGDYMASTLVTHFPCRRSMELENEWDAAKEGKGQP